MALALRVVPVALQRHVLTSHRCDSMCQAQNVNDKGSEPQVAKGVPAVPGHISSLRRLSELS